MIQEQIYGATVFYEYKACIYEGDAICEVTLYDRPSIFSTWQHVCTREFPTRRDAMDFLQGYTKEWHL